MVHAPIDQNQSPNLKVECPLDGALWRALLLILLAARLFWKMGIHACSGASA